MNMLQVPQGLYLVLYSRNLEIEQLEKQLCLIFFVRMLFCIII